MTPIIYNPKEEEERVLNWTGFARHLYQEEIALQNESKISILQCTRIEEIEDAKKQITEAKKKHSELVARRKSTTSILDNLCDRLRQPEAEMDKYIQASNALVLAQTRLRDEAIAKNKAIEDERAAIILKCKNHKIESQQRISASISKGVVKLLEHALNSNIEPKDIKVWLKQYPFKSDNFAFIPPVIKSDLISIEEIKQLIANHAWYLADNLAPAWDEALEVGFSDYAVSYQNKTAALEKAEQMKAEQMKAEQLKAEQLKAANTLNAIATPMIDTAPAVKIKQTYIVSMPDTFESATTIIQAFYANANLCRPHIMVKSFLKLGVDNICVALAGVKNNDERFNPEGIIWGVKERV
jgi:hypothetical protein